MTDLVRVAAAVIFDGAGRVLLAQRPPGKVYEGYWEFPGGKLEAGESPRDALARELAEELGLRVRRAAPWLVRRFVYPHAHVELHFFRVLAFDGQPVGHDGQAFAWQTIDRYTVGPLLPANAPILRALRLPARYGITMAEELGEERMLERAERALASGLSLVQVREKTWPPDRRLAFARRIVSLAAAHGATVFLNGTAEEARAAHCHGVHWTAAMLMAASERPDDLLCGASCHTREEIAHAGALGLDLVLVGPVARTPTHPHALPLGWQGFAQLIEGTQVPVFALGGVTDGEGDRAIDAGAHGIAMRRGAWLPAAP